MADSDGEGRPWPKILAGPALGLVATMALWANEARFDYHRAARNARFLSDPADANGVEGEPIGFSGAMDTELEVPGEYLASFHGYLRVYRSAEIYCWDRDEDDDSVTWTLRWMSSVEGNSRNSGVKQTLRSDDFTPEEFRVGDNVIGASSIQFCDSSTPIPIGSIPLGERGRELGLESDGTRLNLYKHQPSRLGDERVSYSGIPVPSLATYFGQLDRGRGSAHIAVSRTGWIHGLIHDTGILHHIVAGDRDTALTTMKSHLARTTWIVRIAGTVGMVFAFILFFSGAFSILLHIPLIGRIAEWGLFLASVILGVGFSLVVMVTSYVVHHPLAMVVLAAIVAGLVYWFRRRRDASGERIRTSLATEFGHTPTRRELVEREFLALLRLARLDEQVDSPETKVLHDWARKRGINGEEIERLQELADAETESGIAIGSEQELRLLVQMALADDAVSPTEMKLLRQAARHAGCNDKKLHELIRRVRRMGDGGSGDDDS